MESVKVHNKEARLHQFVSTAGGRHTRTLKPGVNLVPKHVVEQMKGNAVFMGHVTEGRIVIEEGTVPEAATKSLDGLKPLEAVKLVQDTLDVEQLIAWKTNAKTLAPKVLSAIDNQLAKIDAMAGDKKE